MFVILVTILADLQDKPYSQWPITLNAIVTILTATMRSTLLIPEAETMSEPKWLCNSLRPVSLMEQFDVASRYPPSSLQAPFTWSWKGCSALGALVTMLSVHIDLFSQKALQDYGCLIQQEGLAGVARTNNYTQWWSIDSQVVISENDQDSIYASSSVHGCHCSS